MQNRRRLLTLWCQLSGTKQKELTVVCLCLRTCRSAAQTGTTRESSGLFSVCAGTCLLRVSSVVHSNVAEQIGHGLSVVDAPDGLGQDQTHVYSPDLWTLQLLHLVRNGVRHHHLQTTQQITGFNLLSNCSSNKRQ